MQKSVTRQKKKSGLQKQVDGRKHENNNQEWHMSNQPHVMDNRDALIPFSLLVPKLKVSLN